MAVHELLRKQLRSTLRENALPIFDFGTEMVPAASIWTGARSWISYFRSLSLEKGSRILIHLPESSAFIRVLLACLWEGYTAIPIAHHKDLSKLIDQLDISLGISTTYAGDFIANPDEHGNPPEQKCHVRTTTKALYPEVAFILQSSGTTGEPRYSMLSLKNVMSVIESHVPYYEWGEDTRLLSVLPWTHCFGLVLELLPALMHRIEVHRIPNYGRDIARIYDKLRELEFAHFNAVPLHLLRLIDRFSSTALEYITSGIIGGAAISATLAEQLQGSKLRVGYGQTEASPGICIGDKGEFSKGILGKACGCEVRINTDNVLEFKGENAFLGYWNTKGEPHWNKSSWITTGDRVVSTNDGQYIFLGRIDDRIKLPNGREINPQEIEAEWIEKLPELKYSCLFSRDGIHLDVAFCVNEEYSIEQFKHAFLTTFPNWASKLPTYHFLTPGEWPMNPKGDTIRSTFLQENNYVT